VRTIAYHRVATVAMNAPCDFGAVKGPGAAAAAISVQKTFLRKKKLFYAGIFLRAVIYSVYPTTNSAFGLAIEFF